MRRTLFDEEHDLFRSSFRRFLDTEVVPRNDEFERSGIMDRSVFAKAGSAGFLGMDVDEALGGGGVADFRYNVIVGEEIQAAGVNACGLGLTLHNDICLPYFTRLGDDEQEA